MKLCIPVTKDAGLKSPVCAHFGSAPLFLVVDTESGDCRSIANQQTSTMRTGCASRWPSWPVRPWTRSPLAVSAAGALGKLQAAGLRIYLAGQPTVAATLADLEREALVEVDPDATCGLHGHGHGRGEGD